MVCKGIICTFKIERSRPLSRSGPARPRKCSYTAAEARCDPYSSPAPCRALSRLAAVAPRAPSEPRRCRSSTSRLRRHSCRNPGDRPTAPRRASSASCPPLRRRRRSACASSASPAPPRTPRRPPSSTCGAASSRGARRRRRRRPRKRAENRRRQRRRPPRGRSGPACRRTSRRPWTACSR